MENENDDFDCSVLDDKTVRTFPASYDSTKEAKEWAMVWLTCAKHGTANIDGCEVTRTGTDRDMFEFGLYGQAWRDHIFGEAY